MDSWKIMYVVNKCCNYCTGMLECNWIQKERRHNSSIPNPRALFKNITYIFPDEYMATFLLMILKRQTRFSQRFPTFYEHTNKHTPTHFILWSSESGLCIANEFISSTCRLLKSYPHLPVNYVSALHSQVNS
jgi:hypothetical protein